MVETLEGIDNVERIAAIPGVDGIYIGPADLAVSMGLAPGLQIQPGAHAEAIARIVRACVEAGKVAAMSGDPNHLAAQGLRMITAGGDAAFLQAGLNSVVQARQRLSAGHSGEAPGPS
jgi:4-hydroxy-2-oxoheptanedioate aldolase